MTLQPGPIRDVLAKLSEAARDGDGMTVNELSQRTGVPYGPMERRLMGLDAQGLVAPKVGSPRLWTITDKGRSLL